MPSGQCRHCGCSDIDLDPSRGDAVCMQCGAVLEESIIVNEVQYAQDCSGATRAIGQLVSADGNIASGLNLGHSYGLGKESRVITLQNARRNISNLCSQLKLPERCVDIAHNFYKMALMKKFTQGRKNAQVVAACVYMVCRKEETPHMLLDLSDILHINVYDLGKTYLRLSTLLCINIPAIDPSLYILRFAHQLQFTDKTHEVSVTASRLVQRMKRDWMHTGRRPSGLCGAALLVAARMHNFNRTVDDVIKVVKVCQATVRKRLNEFSDTPSSRLTLNEFMTIDLEEEQDPPAFKAARKKKLAELEDENKFEEATNEISTYQNIIEKAMEEAREKRFARYAKLLKIGDSENNLVENHPNDAESTAEYIAGETIETINRILTNDDIVEKSCENLEQLLSNETTPSPPCDSGIESASQSTVSLSQTNEDSTAEPIQECTEVFHHLDTSGLDDAELDAYIMDDNETKSKTEFWFKSNKEYLKEQKEKEERRKLEEAENANKEPKKKRKRQKRGPIQANTAEEAIEKMMQQKKMSRKLDYNVLQNLNFEIAQADAEKDDVQPENNESSDKRPLKRPKSSKSKVPLGPLPKSIRRGISAIIGNARRNETQKANEDVLDAQQMNTESHDETAGTSTILPEEIINTEDNGVADIPAVDVEEDDEEIEDDEEDDEDAPNFSRHLSAAELLSQHRGERPDEFCDYDYEDYDD